MDANMVLATIANNEDGRPRVELRWCDGEIQSREIGAEEWQSTGDTMPAAEAITQIGYMWADTCWDLQWADEADLIAWQAAANAAEK